MYARFVGRIAYPTPLDTETLFYFLLEEPERTPGFAYYGVRVLETSSTGTLISQETVLNVTADRFFMMRILTILINGSVSPCALRDVVEDLSAVG